MTARAFLASALVLAFSAAAFAQPPRPPAAPAAPAAPQAPGQPAAPAPPSPATLPTPPPPATLPTPPTPPTPPAPPAPPVVGQHVNIRVDVTITDQRGTAPALKKTVSIVTADGLNGRIRSQTNYTVIGEIPLNVDAESLILTDGKIRVRVNLQYDLPGNTSGQAAEVPNAGVARRAQVQENLALILENGKPLVAAQSADPVGDRQVTIELKATVLK